MKKLKKMFWRKCYTCYSHNMVNNNKNLIMIIFEYLHNVWNILGKVTQITACKGLKLRGQAWVMFQDVASATNALRGI